MDYGILSLIPPVLAVTLAFCTKQVVLSLLIGTFSGALIISDFHVVAGFTTTFSTYVSEAMTDSSHAAILVFTLTIGGMVALLTSTGGLQAIAAKLSKRIKNPRGAQIITSILGCLVFFDDYANILVVGPTARPLSDSLRVSREKQTYIVHTTAGIVAGIAVMTTWIGFEIGLVNDSFADMGYEVNGFGTILRNIPYMFYNIFAIVILFAVAIMVRDFGPMYKAEKRARLTGKLVADDAQVSEEDMSSVQEETTGKIYYAVLPILTLVLVIFFGIWISGYRSLETDVSLFSWEGLRLSFGEADPMPPIVWAAVLSTLVAAVIAKLGCKMSIKNIYQSWLGGFCGLCEVGIILVLAWSIGGVIAQLGTADYLISIVAGNVPAGILPAIIFVTSCVISFCTGTSWGTMPVVFPIAIPLMAAMVEDPTDSPLILASIAAVLSGSIFGDQTSPISDSSIISAASTGCDVLHHIKTEIPYSVVPAGLAVIGYLLIGFAGLPTLILLAAGMAAAALIVRFVGKSTKTEDLRKEYDNEDQNL